MKKLLIVESPAKAKKIGDYLGRDFVVKSSVGHIRDLPKENGAIKIDEAGSNAWTFTPKYVISDGKEKVVAELKAATKAADEIYLASDPDREGEAIAWHLKEVLAPTAGQKPFLRVTYNEITKAAVLKAVQTPRDIDMPLVDAQQARRILDRLVGYRVSPLLWKNVNCANSRTLSAGRVQSVALRLLVERQREIDAFVPEVYLLLGVEARKGGDEKTFVAKLARLDGEKPDIRTQEDANRLLLDLSDATLRVTDVKAQAKSRHALPPFTTSTLQQSASSVLGFSPGKTMKIAQKLYEAGFITYMRTDSVNISAQARAAAKAFIETWCGKEFYPATPNVYKVKAKAGVEAQGAHEAIRPTDVELSPKRAGAGKLDGMDLKLYDLIWRRFVASQMADAKTTVRTISLEAVKPTRVHEYLFTASATTVDFEGFLKIMNLSLKKKGKDGEDDDDSDEVAYLPAVVKGDALAVVRWLCDEKKTKGPTHYSEASLIKALEENGVGRPSTYAQTIETLKMREYAKVEKKKLIPLERGILVCDWLVKKMNDLFSVGYTAQMEGELDKVEFAEESMNAMLSSFYAKFVSEIGAIAEEERPDPAKFDVVFALLDQVKEWKEAKKVGRRVYDDRAFVESVKEQAKAGQRPLSARQLQFLVRMALMYASQIQDCEARLKEAGLSAGKVAVEHADPKWVAYCFDTLARLGGPGKSPFLRSLQDQYERGKPLSVKQFAILARTVGEQAVSLEDGAAIREALQPFVPEGFDDRPADPAAARILSLLQENVKTWRPVQKSGKRVFDDQAFVASLTEQFARRHTLSPRQVGALKRLASLYRKQVPAFVTEAEALGLKKSAGDDDDDGASK